MAQVVEYLRTNYRALNSNLNTAKKKSTNWNYTDIYVDHLSNWQKTKIVQC
jgi:hypothetical protein